MSRISLAPRWIAAVVAATWLMVCSAALSGCSSAGPEIHVRDAVMLVPGTDDQTSVYLTIANSGDEDDRLLNADTDIAPMTMLHRTSIDAKGRASMSEDRWIDVAAGSEVELAPGGLHLMLMHPEEHQPGDSFVLWLSFRRAGTVKVIVKVVSIDGVPT